MGWKVVERRIGRAGERRRRAVRQREWAEEYGPRNWDAGYLLEGVFTSQV